MRNDPLKEDELENKTFLALVSSTVFYFSMVVWRRDKNFLFVSAMGNCLFQDPTPESTSALGPVAIADVFIVIATIVFDQKLIKTLDTSIFGEDGEIHQALQDAIRVPTRATILSSIRFSMIIIVLAVSQFMNATPEGVR